VTAEHPPAIDAAAVGPRLDEVRRRIAGAGGGPEVQVLAVTKGFGPDAVTVARGLGLVAVGENYAQELLAKVEMLGADAQPTWHFLGRLQRNKVRQLAPVVAVWESVDRVALVDEIARRAPGAVVDVQLNLSGEAQKGGADLAEAPELVARARAAGLVVRGLMGVAPAGPPETSRPGFRALAALADELGLAGRSMGMSADLEVAVEEGSTEVRVGTALFGPRPLRTPAAPGPSGPSPSTSPRG
jgi:PLP dependent protein